MRWRLVTGFSPYQKFPASHQYTRTVIRHTGE
jgi:hypothetical protein